MNGKEKIIIVLLIVIIFIIGGLITYTLFNQNSVEYQTIALSNATTIDVPVSDKASFFSDDLGIKYYQDDKYGIQVISWNSQEELSLKGAVDIAAQFEKQKGGNTPTQEDGITIYENKETGYYVIETGNDTTHDNILIMAKDKDVALHMFKSIKYGVSNINKVANLDISVPSFNNTTKTPSEIDRENGIGLSSYDWDHSAYDDYDDDYEDYEDYDDDYGSSVETTTDSSSSSSQSSSSSVETTVDEE